MKICLAAAVAIFVAAAVAVVFLHRPAESTWVEITQDGKVLYTDGLTDNLEMKSDMPAEVIVRD